MQLAQKTASTVKFSEERQFQYLTEPLFVEGTLSFRPPAHLERRVTWPNPERMIVDGNLLTIEDEPQGSTTSVLLSDYPTLDAFITALRSVLAGDHRTLERLYETSLDGDQAAWSLRLTPKSQDLREAVVDVRIIGKDGKITSLEVTEADGDRSIIRVHGKI